MNAIVHVVAAIGVNHVNIIRIAPRYRPRIDEPERVSAILETSLVIVSAIDVEAMPAAEAGAVMVVGNTAVRVTPSAPACLLRWLHARLGLLGILLL